MDKWIVALVIFGVLGLAFIAAQSQPIVQRQDRTEQKVDDFIVAWENRVNISNQVNNGTQSKIEKTQDLILEFIKGFNQTNEEKRTEAVYNLTEAIESGNNVSKENNQLLKRLLSITP